MSRDLDAIPWNSLLHAYGEASDLPEAIRNFRSDDFQKQKQGLSELWSTIFHQGTRYTATEPAIPFIVDVLADPKRRLRSRLAQLLICLALGYEERFVPFGIIPEKYREIRKRLQSEQSEEQLARNKRFGFGPLVDLACYDAVNANLEPIIPLLADRSDPTLWKSIAYLFAWFPDYADSIIPHLLESLEELTDQAALATGLLTLGYVRKNSDYDDSDPAPFPEFLQHRALLVRTAAALAHSHGNLEESLPVLFEALRRPQTLRRAGREVPFLCGDLIAYIVRILLHLGGKAVRPRVIPVLAESLPHCHPDEMLTITRYLLNLIASGPDKKLPDFRPKDWDADALIGIRALAKHGGWTFKRERQPAFGRLLAAFGLPELKKDFRQMVKELGK